MIQTDVIDLGTSHGKGKWASRSKAGSDNLAAEGVALVLPFFWRGGGTKAKQGQIRDSHCGKLKRTELTYGSAGTLADSSTAQTSVAEPRTCHVQMGVSVTARKLKHRMRNSELPCVFVRSGLQESREFLP